MLGLKLNHVSKRGSGWRNELGLQQPWYKISLKFIPKSRIYLGFQFSFAAPYHDSENAKGINYSDSFLGSIGFVIKTQTIRIISASLNSRYVRDHKRDMSLIIRVAADVPTPKWKVISKRNTGCKG